MCLLFIYIFIYIYFFFWSAAINGPTFSHLTPISWRHKVGLISWRTVCTDLFAYSFITPPSLHNAISNIKSNGMQTHPRPPRGFCSSFGNWSKPRAAGDGGGKPFSLTLFLVLALDEWIKGTNNWQSRTKTDTNRHYPPSNGVSLSLSKNTKQSNT